MEDFDKMPEFPNLPEATAAFLLDQDGQAVAIGRAIVWHPGTEASFYPDDKKFVDVPPQNATSLEVCGEGRPDHVIEGMESRWDAGFEGHLLLRLKP